MFLAFSLFCPSCSTEKPKDLPTQPLGLPQALSTTKRGREPSQPGSPSHDVMGSECFAFERGRNPQPGARKQSMIKVFGWFFCWEFSQKREKGMRNLCENELFWRVFFPPLRLLMCGTEKHRLSITKFIALTPSCTPFLLCFATTGADWPQSCLNKRRITLHDGQMDEFWTARSWPINIQRSPRNHHLLVGRSSKDRCKELDKA